MYILHAIDFVVLDFKFLNLRCRFYPYYRVTAYQHPDSAAERLGYSKSQFHQLEGPLTMTTFPEKSAEKTGIVLSLGGGFPA